MEITLDDYVNHWRIKYGYLAPKVLDSEFTADMLGDAKITISLVNAAVAASGLRGKCLSSGWRPKEVNRCIPGSAIFSNHCLCRAADVSDADGELAKWCLANVSMLAKLRLWIENPARTRGWVHFQIVPPKSGNRIFNP